MAKNSVMVGKMRNTSFNMVVSLPDGETKHYSLNTEKVRIGRATENQITIPVGSVSSFHCEILRKASGQLILVDLGSKNGTDVNGEKAVENRQIVLGNGDFILFGQTVYGQIVSVSNVTTDTDEDTEVAVALAKLAKGGPTIAPSIDPSDENGEKTRKIIKKEPLDLDEEYEEIAMNPVAAAVAKATRPFTGDE